MSRQDQYHRVHVCRLQRRSRQNRRFDADAGAAFNDLVRREHALKCTERIGAHVVSHAQIAQRALNGHRLQICGLLRPRLAGKDQLIAGQCVITLSSRFAQPVDGVAAQIENLLGVRPHPGQDVVGLYDSEFVAPQCEVVYAVQGDRPALRHQKRAALQIRHLQVQLCLPLAGKASHSAGDGRLDHQVADFRRNAQLLAIGL